VADQAKNICDQTVFAVRGVAKIPKVYRILFLDQAGSGLGQLATAIGRKNYPDIAEFTSATPGLADPVSDALHHFLVETGLPDEDLDSVQLEALEYDISDYMIIVSLNGRFSDYIKKVPFHSAALNWSLPKGGELAEQYRQLHTQIIELISLLAGTETTQA
jgi:hypothetical protein